MCLTCQSSQHYFLYVCYLTVALMLKAPPPLLFCLPETLHLLAFIQTEDMS